MFWSTLRGQQQWQARKEKSKGPGSGEQQLCSVTETGLPGTRSCFANGPGLIGTEVEEICFPSVFLRLGCGKYYFLEDEAVYWLGTFLVHLFCCCCEFGLEASPSS